ncbi:hypothetical protein ACFQ3D_12125 [Paenibacillus urinalis]
MHLKLINSPIRTKPNYYDLYTNALIKSLERMVAPKVSLGQVDILERKRTLFYGLNVINHLDTSTLDHELLEKTFERMYFLKMVAATLTPNEFENVFPITKNYDGIRYGAKDYFFTKKSFEKIGEDKIIGKDIHRFMWDYQNEIVNDFIVNEISIASSVRKFQGGKGIMEEFLEQQGVKAFSMLTDEDGKRYIYDDETGGVARIKKPIPRYLKVIK